MLNIIRQIIPTDDKIAAKIRVKYNSVNENSAWDWCCIYEIKIYL